MYTILIVDDEQVERDGIKFLIQKYKLDLSILEAENGQEALECLKSNRVNILFTDIKMPFMDGLDLSHYAQKMNPNLKIIIFSAYGEFDYAKKAIHNSVRSYILKPIDPEEFFDVMSKTIKACSDEVEEREKELKLLTGYQKMLVYEKEELLTSLLGGAVIEDEFLRRLHSAGIDFDGKNTVLLCIYLKNRLFDSKDEEISNLLKTALRTEFEYVNLNECQSVVFLKNMDTQHERYRLEKIGDRLQNALFTKYQVKACLVFGKTVRYARDFHEELKSIEGTLDLSFFFDDSVVLFADDGFSNEMVSTELVDKIISDINIAIDSRDSRYATRSIEQLFSTFKVDGSISSIYIKYICAELTKKALSKIHKKNGGNFKSSLEKLFAENNIGKLKEDMVVLVSRFDHNGVSGSEDMGKKVINKVMEIIEQEYMKDIGLEYIAGKVYLTPSYLSYMFKKETGKSFVKYVTLFRLRKAKELLQGTNMRIVDICGKVGYSKLSYFCAIFKNNYGMTPAKYRERGKG